MIQSNISSQPNKNRDNRDTNTIRETKNLQQNTDTKNHQTYTSICTVPFHLQPHTTFKEIHPAGKPTYMFGTNHFSQDMVHFRKKNHTFRNSDEYDIVSISSYHNRKYKNTPTEKSLGNPVWK
tara:strand:+ start:310 stop:678 length:369 start_codon:yes stop_codon:yes gene_type:complete